MKNIETVCMKSNIKGYFKIFLSKEQITDGTYIKQRTNVNLNSPYQ